MTQYLKQVIRFFKAAIRLRQMVELVECKFRCMLWYRLPVIRNDTLLELLIAGLFRRLLFDCSMETLIKQHFVSCRIFGKGNSVG